MLGMPPPRPLHHIAGFKLEQDFAHTSERKEKEQEAAMKQHSHPHMQHKHLAEGVVPVPCTRNTGTSNISNAAPNDEIEAIVWYEHEQPTTMQSRPHDQQERQHAKASSTQNSKSTGTGTGTGTPRTTLGPVRKKKSKKRAGKSKQKRRRSRVEGVEECFGRSVALPTIEESDCESIFSNSASSHQSGIRITINSRHDNRNANKTQDQDLETGAGLLTSVSDTSDTSSSSHQDSDEATPTVQPISVCETSKKSTRTMLFQLLTSKKRSLIAMGGLLLLLCVVLIASLAGGRPRSETNTASEKNAAPVPTFPQPPMANPSSSPPLAPVTPVHPNETPTSFQSMYINAGGESPYADAAGRVWVPDTFDGPIYQQCDGSKVVFYNTLDRDLYCRERYGRNGTDLRYSFRIPKGRYQVVLHFAEIFHKQAGKRIMDIHVADVTAQQEESVRQNYDIFVAAGGPFRATQLFFDVDILSGLSLKLSPKPNSDNAKINAMEVHHFSNARSPEEYLVATPTGAPVVSVSASPEEYLMTSPTGAPVISPSLVPSPPTTVVTSQIISINAGSSVATLNIEGQVWTSDSQIPADWITGGTPRDECGSDETSVSCSYRSFSETGQYKIPLPNGTYKVLLYFSEPFPENNVGDRIFSIFIQNMNIPFRRSYDILKVAGAQGRTTSDNTIIEVSNESITIAFKSVKGDPLICGIQIVPITV